MRKLQVIHLHPPPFERQSRRAAVTQINNETIFKICQYQISKLFDFVTLTSLP